MIIPVILSGGTGTRLWPLSSPAIPKQFLPLVGAHSLLQETVRRLEGLPDLAAPIVICNAAHADLVTEQLAATGGAASAIVLEPAGRNTAPAIGVAAQMAPAMVPGSGSARDPVLLVLPADQLIADPEAFRAAVAAAVKAAAAGRLVTFGIVPTRPETGFGYIERGTAEEDWWTVERFVEKPDRETAEAYLASGRFLWNSGMFVFGAQTFLQELACTAPGIHAACQRAVAAAGEEGGFTRLGPEFLDCPSDSIDYAVMEKTDRAAVVPLDAGWSDVGSWSALHEASELDASGNSVRGDVIIESSRNTFVWTSSRPVAVIGVDDLIVVETEDAVLVMRKDHAQDVRQVGEAVRGLRDRSGGEPAK